MGHAKIIRPVKLTTTFPEDIRVKMDLYLFSKVEGRVPKGAYQEFLVGLIKEFFTKLESRNDARNAAENRNVESEADRGDTHR